MVKSPISSRPSHMLIWLKYWPYHLKKGWFSYIYVNIYIYPIKSLYIYIIIMYNIHKTIKNTGPSGPVPRSGLHLPVTLPHPHQLPRALGALALPLLAIARCQPALSRDHLAQLWGFREAIGGICHSSISYVYINKYV